jgi:hypothetical protein
MHLIDKDMSKITEEQVTMMVSAATVALAISVWYRCREILSQAILCGI